MEKLSIFCIKNNLRYINDNKCREKVQTKPTLLCLYFIEYQLHFIAI